MLGNWYAVPVSHVSWTADDLFATEFLPLLMVEDRLYHRSERFTLEQLRQTDAFRRLIETYSPRITFGSPEFDAAVQAVREHILADPAFHRHPVTLPVSGGFSFVTMGRSPYPVGEPLPESALEDIKQQMAEQNYREAEPQRQARLDAAWPELLAAMSLWRPQSDDHLAPVVLFADPLFAQMLTPERGREILALNRL